MVITQATLSIYAVIQYTLCVFRAAHILSEQLVLIRLPRFLELYHVFFSWFSLQFIVENVIDDDV